MDMKIVMVIVVILLLLFLFSSRLEGMMITGGMPAPMVESIENPDMLGQMGAPLNSVGMNLTL